MSIWISAVKATFIGLRSFMFFIFKLFLTEVHNLFIGQKGLVVLFSFCWMTLFF